MYKSKQQMLIRDADGSKLPSDPPLSPLGETVSIGLLA